MHKPISEHMPKPDIQSNTRGAELRQWYWLKSDIAERAREAHLGFQSKIADHNQFNQYTRNFLADNPDLGMSDVRRIWQAKTQLPSSSGRHVYSRSDLDLV